ncbi:MAG: glycosyltransferase family 9 protein [Gammaproteobacteria bacterium]|jgi:heptosyltransferase I|nr:glycosyltransferase family 9 protein [Gammaproteobacteria bacterium]
MPDIDFQRDVDRLCIVMLSAIGDAVHVLPVANALKRAKPQVSITWLIQPVPHILVRDHPAIDEFVMFERKRGPAVLGSYRNTLREIRKTRFDLVIGLQVYFKAGLLTAGIRADAKLGFDRDRARDLNWLFTTHRIPAHPVQHVQDQYFEFLDYLGVDHEPVEWGITLTEEERRRQGKFFSAFERPVCAVVVGTSKPEKNWPVERYAELADHLNRDFGFQVVLLGGPSPVEQDAAAQIERLCETGPVNALGNDLRRLLYLLDGAALAVSPDTGPFHIACAIETPVVGLFGYTNPKRTGPYRKYTNLVVDGYQRYPGEDYPVTMAYRDGMKRITVEKVLEKVQLARGTYLE